VVPGFFDPPLERRNSDSVKWRKFASGDRDIIGAWVADMDLPTAESIIEAVRTRLDERVFGYSMAPEALFEVVMARLEEHFGWKTQRDWFVVQPGVVPLLFFATNCVGGRGDSVMAPTPNYHYFLETADYTGRRLLPVDCRPSGGRWQIDFEQMANTIASDTRMFLLCNPYNPVGRVLDREELEQIAAICLANGTKICSDEIHCDLVLDDDREHIPIASIDEEIERNSITLISPSKAFNLPGIGGFALAIIPDESLRTAFSSRAYGVATHPGALAYAAAQAAYSSCDDWLAETLNYLRGNRDMVEDAVARMNGLSMCHVEGTFLAWIDVNESGLDDPVARFLEGGVALSDGHEMGSPDHLRLNFACHRSTLEELLQRIAQVLD